MWFKSLSSKLEAPSYTSVYLFARNFVSFHDLEVNPGHKKTEEKRSITNDSDICENCNLHTVQSLYRTIFETKRGFENLYKPLSHNGQEGGI